MYIHYLLFIICSIISYIIIWYKEYHFDRDYILFKKKYGIVFGGLIYTMNYWGLCEIIYWFWFIYLRS